MEKSPFPPVSAAAVSLGNYNLSPRSLLLLSRAAAAITYPPPQVSFSFPPNGYTANSSFTFTCYYYYVPTTVCTTKERDRPLLLESVAYLLSPHDMEKQEEHVILYNKVNFTKNN